MLTAVAALVAGCGAPAPYLCAEDADCGANGHCEADLHCSIDVPMVDAALGTAIGVDGILDGPIELTVPPGTQPGAVLTLRGHGMPHLRSEARGNLHAHVDVVVPAKLEPKDAELLREIKANRHRDVAAVRSAHANVHAGNNGGLFSRLRETFSGR